jgi:TPR repeat protein
VRALGSLAAPLLASLALGACAAPSSYMGISFAPGAAASNLQELARRAQTGDKQAQLDLGVAYEEGRGVAVDVKRAEGLYRMAACDSSGRIWIYVPANGKHSTGKVVPDYLRPDRAGLPKARIRLLKLESKMKMSTELKSS